MKTKVVKKITFAAMLLAVGYVLPFLTGQIPEIGNMLLPMHIPVMLSGLILGPWYGLFVGAMLPLTRSLIFSAPPLFPNAVGMVFELATYGFVVGFLFSRAKHRCIISLYRCLLISMLAGRAVWGVAQTILLGFGESPFSFAAFISGAFLNAIPGIILQLILIPAIMLALDKTHLVPMKRKKKCDEAECK